MRTKGESIILCRIVVLAICSCQQAESAVIYEQPPRVITRDPGVFSNTGGQTAADRFLMPFDAIIRSIRWFDSYNGAELSPGTTLAEFRLSFYENDVDRPALSPFFRETLSSSVTDSGLRVDDPSSPRDGDIVYEFTVTVPTPIPIRGGDKIWLEITEADGSTPSVGLTQWLWTSSRVNPSTPSAFRNDRLGAREPWKLGNLPDLAFAIEGSEAQEAVVPIQPGDSNLDGRFDASDIILTLGGGKYESGESATWGDGDWNGAPNPDFPLSGGIPPPGNGLFDSNDVIAALGTGLYETGPYAATLGDSADVNNVPEPSTFVIAALGLGRAKQ